MLVLHWASAQCVVGTTQCGRVLATCSSNVETNQPIALPHMVETALRCERGVPVRLDLIVVVVAPGRFTPLRSSAAYANGLGMSLDIPVVGVTEGEALRHALAQHGGRKVWCCWNDRSGQILLDRGQSMTTVAREDLPFPEAPVALAGEAAAEVAAWLAAQGADVQLTHRRVPSLVEIALTGQALRPQRTSGGTARPLYTEPPAVRPGLREHRPPPAP